MNEQNYAHLRDQVKYLGFGDQHQEILEQHLRAGKEIFVLTVETELHKKYFRAALKFRRSTTSSTYFLNSYRATLRMQNGEKREQTFYLSKGKGITAKEAYNLLDGRAVYRELANRDGQPYHAWIQLDFEQQDRNDNYEFRQFHENYGFDLTDTLSRYPIEGWGDPAYERDLVGSLQKGNLQPVGLIYLGRCYPMKVEANPRYKQVTFYDEKMVRLSLEQTDLLRKDRVPADNPAKEQEAVEASPGKEAAETSEPSVTKTAKRKNRPLKTGDHGAAAGS